MRSPFLKTKSERSPEDGLTLIEVMLAGAILVVGFMGLFGLFLTAIASNNRNKLDSTSTMLAQAVAENITSVLTNTPACATNYCLDQVLDCTGTHNLYTEVNQGATLSSDGTKIDFSKAIVTGYQMDYVVGNVDDAGTCDPQTETTYDVRWNIHTVTSSGPLDPTLNTGSSPSGTWLVIVGVKKKMESNGGNLYFAFPVNLRTYVAN